MRVAVIGAGAVGGALALLLARAGHEVSLVTRSADSAGTRTLHLSGAFGVHSAVLPSSPAIPADTELIVLATKAMDAQSAAAPHLVTIAVTPTMVVQNGLDGVSRLAAQLDSAGHGRGARLMSGLVTFAVNRADPDRVVATAPGVLSIGALDGALHGALETIRASLDLGVPTSIAADFEAALWSKLLINQVNAIPAVTGLSVQEVGRDGTLRAVLAASLLELLQILDRVEASLVALGPLTVDLLSLAARIREAQRRGEPAGDLAEELASQLSAAFGETPNHASTLQSIRRGEPTEIDALNGAVAARGSALGIPTPVNARLTSLVHDAEAGASPLDAAQLKASTVTAAVNDWFARGHRPLPWRDLSTTPWGVLTSETMLQQTQAVRVAPKWLELIERWPTPTAMAAASEAEVLRFWDRLGYPRRALWLLACARAITSDHGGEVPRDLEALLALPGVGPYTAAAVRSFAYGEPEPVVDTNIRRVLARAFHGDEIAWAPSAKRDSAEMRGVAPSEKTAATSWNASSMELGAVVCTARSPSCARCPISSQCSWLRAGRPAAEKVRRTQAAFGGSDRQMRGMVLRELRAIPGGVEVEFLRTHLDPRGEDTARFERALISLAADGLVARSAADEIALVGD